MSKTGADQGTKQALLYSIFRSIRQIFPVMISIFFCMGVFVFSNVSVSAKEQETVKVGYYFSHKNDNSMQCGNISSYHGKKIGTLKNDQRMTTSLEKWKKPLVRQTRHPSPKKYSSRICLTTSAPL